jgi:glycosyltransferase 2 family protein
MSIPRLRWHTLFIAALTLGLLWLFFRNIELHATWQAIAHARLGLILAAVFVTLLTYIVRAWRWQALLRPIGKARFRTAFRTTVIGFAATFLLPGRVGEVLRPYLLARTEGLKATATFATVIIERLLDVCTVVMLFAVALPFVNVDVGREVKTASAIAVAGSLVALILLFMLAGHPERLGQWAGKLARHLPPRIAHLTEQLVRTFAEGLKVMRHPGQLVLAAFWSVPLWSSIALGVWLTSLAFDLTYPFLGSFLVLALLAAGVSLPTPGGVGGFHYTYLLALTQFFGAPREASAAAALVLHAVSFVPVTLVGMVFMWQDGLTLGSLKGMRAEAAEAEKRE